MKENITKEVNENLDKAAKGLGSLVGGFARWSREEADQLGRQAEEKARLNDIDLSKTPVEAAANKEGEESAERLANLEGQRVQSRDEGIFKLIRKTLADFEENMEYVDTDIIMHRVQVTRNDCGSETIVIRIETECPYCNEEPVDA